MPTVGDVGDTSRMAEHVGDPSNKPGLQHSVKKARSERERVILSADLAAQLGCSEIWEDELEGRLRLAEISEHARALNERGVILSLIDESPNVLKEHILTRLDAGDLAVLKRVNHACRRVVEESSLCSELRLKDFCGSLSRVEWAGENGGLQIAQPINPTAVCTWAAEHGSLEALQWLRYHGFEWDEHTCSAAARRGDLAILKWLRQAGCAFSAPNAASAAASVGNIQALRWLLTESEYPPSHKSASKAAAVAAAGAGRLEVLEWLLQNGSTDSWEEKRLCEAAALHGKLEVLLWLRHEKEFTWNERAVTSAALEGGHLAVLQHLMVEVSCPLDELACATAARRGHLEVLQWLRHENCPWDEKSCINAAHHGHIRVLKWALENGVPRPAGVPFHIPEHLDLELLQLARFYGCPWDAWNKWTLENGLHARNLQS